MNDILILLKRFYEFLHLHTTLHTLYPNTNSVCLNVFSFFIAFNLVDIFFK